MPSGAVPDPVRIERGLARLGRGDRGPLVHPRPSSGARLTALGARVDRDARAGQGLSGAGREQRRDGARGAGAGPPRLLHELGAALAPAGISVRSAHIATYAGQTLDTFYLTGADGLPLPPARVAQAVSLVIDTCDGI